MIAVDGWLTPTRIIGLASTLFAAIACCVAWTKNREFPQVHRLSAALVLVEAALLVDMAINGRWLIHQWIDEQAIAGGSYNHRGGPQIAGLAILCTVTLVGLGVAFALFRGRRGALLASIGALISLGFWCVEVISLHSVDAVLYDMTFGVMPITMVWIISSLMTGVGILRETRCCVRVGVGQTSSSSDFDKSLSS